MLKRVVASERPKLRTSSALAVLAVAKLAAGSAHAQTINQQAPRGELATQATPSTSAAPTPPAAPPADVAPPVAEQTTTSPAAPQQQELTPAAPASSTTTPTEAEQATPAVDQVGEDILVTGTRVVRDGYNAPTPTTVVGAEQIAAKAPANIADFVNELPSLAGSTSPRANVGSVSPGIAGINALDLRNLGENRTLVLLDGQRVAASTLTGLVDINTFPQALIKRVDLVTGGASADWGSDAVAGVVNFVLDKDFTGLKGTVQAGLTTYGDAFNYNVSLAGGAKFADDRGRVLISVEHAFNEGIRGVPRDWYDGTKLIFNPAYTATNGLPQLLVSPRTGFSTATPGGIITAGPLRGTYFGQGGTPTQFNYGPITRDPFTNTPDWEYADFGRAGDLDPRLSRQNVFVRVGYDVAPDVEVFFQGSLSKAESRFGSVNQFNFGNLTIRSDNAFIPASVASRLTALNLTSFTLGTFNGDLGPIRASSERTIYRGIVGANGRFDALGSNWRWDVYGQRSVSDNQIAADVSITANYNRAIDAVRNASGVIVCRSTLTDPGNGCVPLNVLGTGVVTDAARNYVIGRSEGTNKLTQDVFAGTLRGDPFSTWAGPVSIATGIEHRREKVSGTNDALRTSALQAGLPPPYFAGNFLASFGSYHVTEAFLATVVPLAKDLPFAQNLDVNAAVRATDYSTSGYVTTWKVGVNYSPIEDITFRATRSRDIRAPNLAELFQANQTNTLSLADPSRGNVTSSIFQITQGNLGLEPEKADTLGLGAIFRPRFLPGFTVSADYYNIDIGDAISTVNAATVVNQCFLGNTAFCPQITRNAAGVITQVVVQPINLADQVARGVDFEASYRRPLLGGNLSLRMLATRFIKNRSDDGITPAIDTVGTNGTNGTLRNSLPKWRYLGSIGYDNDRLAMSFTARGFSDGVYNTTYIECTTNCPTSTAANMTINDNDIDGAIYFDANITLKLPRQIEAFFSVDNLLNRDPEQIGFGPNIGAAPLSVNPLLYDLLGRNFRAGLRFRM